MAKRSGEYGGGNPYPTNSSPCPCCGTSPCQCYGGCVNTTAETAAYARPQDFGTSVEMMKLMMARGVQPFPQTVFPNPDPDHDGDPLDGGIPGVLDWSKGSNYDPRQDT